MRELRSAAVLPLLALLGVRSAGAVTPYPVNACVSAKQARAAAYCQAALKAWSRWDLKQDAAHRDDALQAAAEKLAAKWGTADAKALAKGTNCAETTLSASAAGSEINSAIGAVGG